MQAVPVAQAHSSQYYPQQAVFALNESSGRLYAAGGAAPSTVHTWDMSQECCTQQVSGLMHYTLVALIYLLSACCNAAGQTCGMIAMWVNAKPASPGHPLLEQC